MTQADIDHKVQQLTKDIALIKEKRIYELENTAGVPKCMTLANRMQKNLDAILAGYNTLIQTHEESIEQEQFDLLAGLLVALVSEVADLSKKQPDGLINSFKVGQINRVLKPLKEIMKNEPSTNFLDILVEAEPNSPEGKTRNTYSDTAVILCQLREACGEYRSKHYDAYWKIHL